MCYEPTVTSSGVENFKIEMLKFSTPLELPEVQSF